jgi:flagellar protein FlgJ
MTSSILKPEAPAYTDLAGLSKLKRAAGNDDPTAIRTVAEQFEAMFTRMMLKSMRDAVGPDPMFGSDQEQMYQGMADDQLSIQLAKGKGLGLADMLVRQLQKMGVKGANAAGGSAAAGTRSDRNAADATGAAGVPGLSAAAAGSAVGGLGAKAAAAGSAAGGLGARVAAMGSAAGGLGARAAAAYGATQRATAATASPPATDAAKANFVQDLWPQAQQAGSLLGVDPRHLIAQAALETNWGQSLPTDATGRCSNNLFGVKASTNWSGPTVTSGTQEFQGGVASSTTAQFKAYATPAESFQDYVALLRNNPRYSSALNTGSDARAFAAGLQRGGYATDPDYASKIAALAVTVADKVNSSSASGTGVNDLKLSNALPIPASTGAL